jgi:subtilisin-like proprotein convertase family protein
MHRSVVSRALPLLLATVPASLVLVAMDSVPAVAAGVVCQRTFSSVPGEVKPINDETSAFSLIDVPDDGLVVTDVDVSVDIRHSRVGDLTVDLLSHSDERILRASTRLFDHAGGGSRDMVDTVFDDEARAPTTWGSGPFIGRFIPATPLEVQDGTSGGQYTLIVGDTVKTAEGTLVEWSLTLTYANCDFDADGAEDHADLCRDLAARTATGCPVTSRAVTAKQRAGKLRGALSSPEAGCRAGRAVTVFRKRPGPDRTVGTATTRADGSWRLRKPKKRGRYYATSPLAAAPDRAECPAVRSRTFRVR